LANDPVAVAAVTETTIRSLPLVHRGKVRDIYAVGDDHLLMIATDRLSAFDVVLPQPLPGKGILLTQLSMYWFNRLQPLIPNHLSTAYTLEDILPDAKERAQAQNRCMIVKRLKALPVEAVVRGYLIGSGWKDYQHSGAVCGIALPANLQLAQQLPEPLFTPAAKADVGDHDENISFEAVVDTIGDKHAQQIKEISIEIYQLAAQHAAPRGMILADTKFEFGLDDEDNLVLMDEVLTPDSSRFWEADTWQPGSNPKSYDKQFVRDYLETLDWDKTAPGPTLPADIHEKTIQRYKEAYEKLTGLTT
jgi:phosphoribosylaminoimidazole-succinocarboxamide synthase